MLLASPQLGKLRGRLMERQPLADYTSWRVGGPADLVFIPADVDDVAEFLKHLPLDVPVTWLGLGSNVLIRDGGLDGAVIITQGALHNITPLQSNMVRAGNTARLGLAGLEFMAGIPGTVGGALTMNAGCYGGETWQRVHAVETINRAGDIQVRPAADFEVSYRHVKLPEAESFIAGHFTLE